MSRKNKARAKKRKQQNNSRGPSEKNAELSRKAETQPVSTTSRRAFLIWLKPKLKWFVTSVLLVAFFTYWQIAEPQIRVVPRIGNLNHKKSISTDNKSIETVIEVSDSFKNYSFLESGHIERVEVFPEDDTGKNLIVTPLIIDKKQISPRETTKIAIRFKLFADFQTQLELEKEEKYIRYRLYDDRGKIITCPDGDSAFLPAIWLRPSNRPNLPPRNIEPCP